MSGIKTAGNRVGCPASDNRRGELLTLPMLRDTCVSSILSQRFNVTLNMSIEFLCEQQSSLPETKSVMFGRRAMKRKGIYYLINQNLWIGIHAQKPYGNLAQGITLP